MSKAIVKVASQEVLAQLGSSYAVEKTGLSIQLPRLGMFSQDQTEEVKNAKGKKEIKIISEAGTFYIDRQTDEVDEDTGKNKWQKDEIGTEIEAIIFYKRKQLRLYDEATEQYTSSPIYDTDDEVIPLFCDKKEVARGTPAELKAIYKYTDDNGKIKSKLEDNRIIYVMYKGEVYQMNLRGSSMYSLMTYERTQNVPATLTKMSSEPMTKGKISWNKMTFAGIRNVTDDEADSVMEWQEKLKQAIAISKASFATQTKKDEGDAELDEMVKDA